MSASGSVSVMLSFCRAPPLHLTPSDLDYNPFSRQRQERFMQAFIPRVLALAPLNYALNVLKHCRVSVQIVQVKKQFFSQATGTTVVYSASDKTRIEGGCRSVRVICRRERGWSLNLSA
jgi:hypothetical protein